MATVSTTIKIDSELKAEAQKFFDEYGLSLSAAVTMFLRQTVQEWAIPFRIGEPQNTRRPLTYEEVIAALEEDAEEARKPDSRENLISHEDFMKRVRGVLDGEI